MSRPDTVEVLCRCLASPKRLSGVLDWKHVNSSVRIGTAIEVRGIISEGLSFRATAIKELPDERVAIVLLIDVDRKPRPFARIDWRGNIHANNHRMCDRHQFLNAGRTHFHDPNLHLHLSISDIFGPHVDLPIATPITPEPTNFLELIEISGQLLHIENLSNMPVPPWQTTAILI
jgi:hypothetical protein